MKGAALDVVRRIVILLTLLLLGFSAELAAQNRSSFANPAEYDSFKAALAQRDPVKRATAMEVFAAWYPNSALRNEALEHAMAAWSAAREPAKADTIAGKLLQVDPNNVHAIASRVYAARTRAMGGDTTAIAPMVAGAEKGTAALARWQKPASLDDAAFEQTRRQLSAVFTGALGFAALQNKDYDTARRYYRESVTAEPDSLPDVYQLAVAQLEGQPIDGLGFWYAARAVALARAAKNDSAAADIDRWARSRYRLYRGSEEGWDPLVARIVAGEKAPPAGFVKAIPRVMTPPERALQLMEDNEPGALRAADWVLILSHREANNANRAAADRLWAAILEKQQGGTRLKIPVKVVAATPDVLEAAVSDEAQAANTAELRIAMARPLAPLPAVGSRIAIIGTLSEYGGQPFSLKMVRAELAPESLPVAGGPCADPRPQMCTRDYRPACGLRRDNTRQTYPNACSACADPQVVTQSAGACPP